MNKEKTILSNIDAIKDSFYTDILDIPTKEDILNQVQCCIIYLQEEKERLKQLCSRYEEEHNNTFIMWASGIKERDIAKEKLEQVKQEIDWIISNTNEDITIARCNMILSLLEDKWK